MTENSQPARSKQEVIQDIERVTQQPGFIYVFAYLCRRDLFLDPGTIAEKNWHESLSPQELGLLAGVMLKQRLQDGYPAEEKFDAMVSRVDALFAELHDAYKAPMLQSLTAAFPRPEGSVAQSTSGGIGDYFAEGIFYDGSGAYDFQYLDFAAMRYEADRHWIETHRGFSIATACAVVREIKTLCETRARTIAGTHQFHRLLRQTSLSILL